MTEESREKVDFLSRYKYLKDNLKVRYDELDEVMTMATKVTSCNDGMPHGSGVSDKIAVAVEQMIEIENSISFYPPKYILVLSFETPFNHLFNEILFVR